MASSVSGRAEVQLRCARVMSAADNRTCARRVPVSCDRLRTCLRRPAHDTACFAYSPAGSFVTTSTWCYCSMRLPRHLQYPVHAGRYGSRYVFRAVSTRTYIFGPPLLSYVKSDEVEAYARMIMMIKCSSVGVEILLSAQENLGYTSYLIPCVAWSANVCFLAFFDLLITPFYQADSLNLRYRSKPTPPLRSCALLIASSIFFTHFRRVGISAA